MLSQQATEKAQRRKLKEHMKPDENAMTVGIVNIMLTAFTVGRWPQSFFILHLIKTTVLLPWRYARFRRQKYQWYMVEFCYFVSYATLIGCFLALIRTSTGYKSALTDYNHILFRVGFSFATGPLVSPAPTPVRLPAAQPPSYHSTCEACTLIRRPAGLVSLHLSEFDCAPRH